MRTVPVSHWRSESLLIAVRIFISMVQAVLYVTPNISRSAVARMPFGRATSIMAKNHFRSGVRERSKIVPAVKEHW
jgi:hypothetical protein